MMDRRSGITPVTDTAASLSTPWEIIGHLAQRLGEQAHCRHATAHTDPSKAQLQSSLEKPVFMLELAQVDFLE